MQYKREILNFGLVNIVRGVDKKIQKFLAF